MGEMRTADQTCRPAIWQNTAANPNLNLNPIPNSHPNPNPSG